jgi:hypothetical protein
MISFCAACLREILDGPILRGGWLFCSIGCAHEPGRDRGLPAIERVAWPAAALQVVRRSQATTR